MKISHELLAADFLNKRHRRLPRLLVSTCILVVAMAGVTGLACFGSKPSPPTDDEVNLVAFYHATGGGNWNDKGNWLSNAPIGQWHGVTTDSDGRVVELSLLINNLLGEIPPELGSLAKLERLNLCGNEIGEEIPPELGDLANLKYLDLAYNNLSGQIPPELGSLVNLEYLDLQNNQLSGNIPVELGSLVSLRGVERYGAMCPTERKGFLPNFESIFGGKPVGLNLSRNRLQGEYRRVWATWLI